MKIIEGESFLCPTDLVYTIQVEPSGAEKYDIFLNLKDGSILTEYVFTNALIIRELLWNLSLFWRTGKVDLLEDGYFCNKEEGVFNIRDFIKKRGGK